MFTVIEKSPSKPPRSRPSLPTSRVVTPATSTSPVSSTKLPGWIVDFGRYTVTEEMGHTVVRKKGGGSYRFDLAGRCPCFGDLYTGGNCRHVKIVLALNVVFTCPDCGRSEYLPAQFRVVNSPDRPLHLVCNLCEAARGYGRGCRSMSHRWMGRPLRPTEVPLVEACLASCERWARF